MIQATDIQPLIVYTTAELAQATHAWKYEVPVIADVETFGLDPKDGKLLGVALCSAEKPTEPVYVALQWFVFQNSTWKTNPEIEKLVTYLKVCFSEVQLVGHNYAYDKLWLDSVLQTDTKWKACTRVMWHMSAAPAGPKPYGLKDAQVELLGWSARGDSEINEQIKARGGSPGPDKYLADLDVLGKYACLDAGSTALLYNYVTPFFDKHEYWWLMGEMVKYSWLLQVNTEQGVKVDRDALEAQVEALSHTKKAYESLFLELSSKYVDRLERRWREDRASRYQPTPQGQAAKEKFLSSWSMQERFLISSDKDKQELFYEIMGLPVLVRTKKKMPSTAFDALLYTIKESGREDLKEAFEAYGIYENAETLLSSYAKSWLESVTRGRLNPRFNPCGTVSYRLSGFKPYLLNPPFEEHELMSCLYCDEGWEGVHADFVSVEPAVTAHYSQDPGLLKVFKEGKGDVYLDLALTLFPQDKGLREGYDPTAPVTAAVKEAFKTQRKVAKVIQLAVQYTGTKYTIQRNLSYAGFSTTLEEADLLVQAYWTHFRKVAVMNEALFRRFEKQGFLRNVVGRIIQVPTTVLIRKKDGSIWEKPIPRYKDLPNRFIQSSAHDLLSFWVLKIARLCKERNIQAKAVILDCHDSTSWQAPKGQVSALEQVFKDALAELNEEVRMTVPVKVEMKRFQTLAGLKGEER